MTAAQEPDSVWVRSDLTPDGTYVPSIDFTPDESRVLTREDATRYATELLRAVEYAEHDAAVVAQLVTIGVETEWASRSIGDLRGDRPPIDDLATWPLRFVPGVAQRDGSPFLAIWHGDKHVGQWTLTAATDHAVHVLRAVTAADLDGAYYRWLRSACDLDEPIARNVVNDLGKWRPTE